LKQLLRSELVVEQAVVAAKVEALTFFLETMKKVLLHPGLDSLVV
jgi:hypothetical protein